MNKNEKKIDVTLFGRVSNVGTEQVAKKLSAAKGVVFGFDEDFEWAQNVLGGWEKDPYTTIGGVARLVKMPSIRVRVLPSIDYRVDRSYLGEWLLSRRGLEPNPCSRWLPSEEIWATGIDECLALIDYCWNKKNNSQEGLE